MYSQARENVNSQIESRSVDNIRMVGFGNEWLQECLSGLDGFSGAMYFAAESEGAYKVFGKKLYTLDSKAFIGPGNKLVAVPGIVRNISNPV